MKPILGEPACAPVPSGSAHRSARDVMALTDQNRCPFCKRRMTDETCPCWNKEND